MFRDFAYAYDYCFSPLLKAFSPTMYFGCNVQDEDVERHVLSKVGSYGYQLNQIIDAMTVLVSRIDRASLTPAEARDVDRFKDLAEMADRASAEFENKPRRAVTRTDLDRMIDEILSLRTTDRRAYEQLLTLAQERLGAARVSESVQGASAP
jgi:hypothetical protein